MAAFLSGLASSVLPMLAGEGMKVLGDFGGDLLGKLFGGNKTAKRIGNKAIGGIQDYLSNSLGEYGMPTPHERYRKPRMMPQSSDYPVQARKLGKKRPPPDLRDYNDEQIAAFADGRGRANKRSRGNNDGYNQRYSNYDSGNLFDNDDGY